MGMHRDTLRQWVRRSEIDAGKRAGLTTDERERLRLTVMLQRLCWPASIRGIIVAVHCSRLRPALATPTIPTRPTELEIGYPLTTPSISAMVGAVEENARGHVISNVVCFEWCSRNRA